MKSVRKHHSSFSQKLSLVVLAMLSTHALLAQETSLQTFTLEDLIPGGKTYSQLRPESRTFVFDGDKAVELTKDNRDKWPQRETPRYSAFTKKNNLFIRTADGDEITVTDEPKGIVCGQAVHRNEFGIESGTFWNPGRSLLAFYRMDERMVTDYPQTDFSTRIATIVPDKYPMAGMTSHVVTVGIFNPATRETIWLKTGDTTDRYLTNVSWNPEGTKVYIIELNRDQNHAELVRYDAASGEREAVLFEERHEKYVEPQHPLTFLPWDSSLFLYFSQRDGYNHLYLYNTRGELVKQVTAGSWVDEGIVGFDKGRKTVIITSRETSPLESTVWAVSLKNGKRTLLGEGRGMHHARLSDSGKFLIDTWSAPDVPRAIDLVDTRSGKAQRLFTADNPWKGYDVPEITVGTVKAADGTTDLYYRMVKPTRFDPTKKYPAVVYVYGGPHAQNVSGGWNYDVRGWDIYMAQLGYVVFTLDNRGSSNRGLEFENCTFRHLGTEEAKDQMEGVRMLKKLDFIDDSRIGVHGWSFGGFMTITMMTRYPETFKVGVAGGPVIDWKYYEVMYGERYMDTPEANPEGYAESSLLNRAADLKGRLQVIIGGNDPTCVPQHTLSFMRACIDAGTQPDLFVYPAQGHNMAGRDRIHLHERITRYFEDYLK